MIRSKKLSKFKGIEHAFFNRLGGKSTGIFKSLNCGPGSSDNKRKILKNLETVSNKINAESKKIILLNQVHSNKFYYIDKNSKLNNKFMGDALITDKRNLPIAVLTADCAPILIHDNDRGMIAAIHAGWKGTYKGIVEKVIKFMIKKGCSSKNITAAIGPCISINNYEVKEDFIKKFIKKDIKNIIFFKKTKNKNYFSLNKYIHFQLRSLNIKKIDIMNKDTFNSKNNFFSARRSISRNENDYGRNISIIMIN
ncbi:peptidoglycan editing factor PgeF [Candidatus Pelagibacter sp. Uisw_092]|uniref:peptidoglycan editing factor PgeF n=1 Tax=Candidatus Pelagibacter sp. Uisw_092 TaxID=3230979 RepID=UPI0039E7CA32